MADPAKNGQRIPSQESCCIDGRATPRQQASYTELLANCPNRTQNTTRLHIIDGCSNSPDDIENAVIETRYFENFDKYVTLPVWGSVQAGVTHANSGSVTLPRNRHDVCYQTCRSDQNTCDGALRTGMQGTCGASYPPACPYNTQDDCEDYAQERGYCLDSADFYFNILNTQGAGRSAYEERQTQFCNCCP